MKKGQKMDVYNELRAYRLGWMEIKVADRGDYNKIDMDNEKRIE